MENLYFFGYASLAICVFLGYFFSNLFETKIPLVVMTFVGCLFFGFFYYVGEKILN